MYITTNKSINYSILEEKIISVDLVLADLDGVIITPEQYFCSYYWYVNYLNSLSARQQHINKLTTIDMFYDCMYKASFKAVDSKLIDTLNKYSSKTVVIGFTGRDIGFQKETQYWIDKVGMNFTKLSFEVSFENNNILEKGILYAGYDANTGVSQDKGNILSHFLQVYSQKVSRIFFIDDTFKNHQK